MELERLVREAVRGNRRAFGELYDRYAKRLYAYLYYRTLNRELAEDLAAEAFLNALEKLLSFRPEAGSFPAWLYGIARHALVDHFRGQRPAVSLDGAGETAGAAEYGDVWELADGADFTLDVLERDRWERLKPHLAALSAEAREIIILRLWDELPYRQIAELTGKSEAACKMAFSRALNVLRQSMPLLCLVAWLLAKPSAC
ncbi:MAG: hypothetical protein A2004_03400 [Spirochaetes bacterium GWC1_61_12]|nr:MAG: hypothetical protein A2Y37_11530 [Spirochaetes bacterium GWB1_60_80]OHD31640.1 MAG: hypothetical protein A2004_03400 [Spirochaetes bacterium GWC1_61_12]OHD43397.1 MAG: hypothetical protein A2Y35_02300 [Spirochaetes bacterium GWE1_60_18]OHD58930.1 MAG: hypothetical protein A2Y32_10745 [Spirochaetes bacterium GWF1_60_12]